MKFNHLFVLGLLFLSGCQAAPMTSEYVVIAGSEVMADSVWTNVAEALKNKHEAVLLSYTHHPKELLSQLKQLKPRYVAVVEKPERLGRDYVIELNQLSRQVDNDVYADFLWGIITGYDAQAAMKMVENSTEPLVVKDAVATIMELHSGKWFNRYAWVDDHHQGLWGEKKSVEDTIATYQLPAQLIPAVQKLPDGKISNIRVNRVNPVDEMQTFYDIYAQYDPDLVVTAAHATERNLEMPFSLGNIKSKDGKIGRAHV